MDVPLPCAPAAAQARARVCAVSGGAEAPPARGRVAEPADPLRGWRRVPARASDERICELHPANLPPAARALLLSQAGPVAARPHRMRTQYDLTIPSAPHRVLLLRRVRLPLPLAPRHCRCRGLLDPLGDHRSACATSGVLASRALPLEHAAARVCSEVGAQVARLVRLASMNFDSPISDERRIEVVANGLRLWHGSQLALDATSVSPLTRGGELHLRADVQPGLAVEAAAAKLEEADAEAGHQVFARDPGMSDAEHYLASHALKAIGEKVGQGELPELASACGSFSEAISAATELGRAHRCRLVVVGVEIGGRCCPIAAAFGHQRLGSALIRSGLLQCLAARATSCCRAQQGH